MKHPALFRNAFSSILKLRQPGSRFSDPWLYDVRGIAIWPV